MADIIDANGLSYDDFDTLRAALVAEYQAIYGADIVVDSDTPDGQLISILAQAGVDVREFIAAVNASFDPGQASGVILDQRVAINGIQRQAGTFTIQNVSVTADRAVTLYGLDQDVETIFTVQDTEGNRFQLVTTYSFSGAGTQSLVFQAEEAGEVITTPNTITIPVTVVVGITAVNNPATYTTLGINQETDAELKIRRSRSVQFASQGYLAGLQAALENISGVEYVKIYENTSGVTDGDGIPSHSIWVIVSGGTNAEIADAIYKKRNAGCGMKGAVTYDVTAVDGQTIVIKWDIVATEDLYIEFDATSLDGTTPVDTAAILAQLPDLLNPGVYEQLNINDLATLVQQIDNNCLVANAGFSKTLMGSYTATLTPTLKTQRFVADSSRINITVL